MSRVCSTLTKWPQMSSKLLILSPAMNVRLDGLNFPMCSGCHQPELRPGTSDQGAGVWTPDITWSLTSSDVSHDHHHCEACSVMVQWLMLLSWSVKRRRGGGHTSRECCTLQQCYKREEDYVVVLCSLIPWVLVHPS